MPLSCRERDCCRMLSAFSIGGPIICSKWSLAAKLRRCKLLFVCVGAGPLDGGLGRRLVTSALSLADFRSYRDDATMSYLQGIGLRTDHDKVYPDLAFSLPEAAMPRGVRPQRAQTRCRPRLDGVRLEV